MKILQLAEKKLNLIFGSSHEQVENIFKELYLESWYTKLKRTAGLSLLQTRDFCHVCENFGILILGFETSYESKYGLNTLGFEFYSEPYSEEWWYNALADLKRSGIIDSIIPYIHIPSEVLNVYLSNE
jgi:hypothetical protein